MLGANYICEAQGANTSMKAFTMCPQCRAEYDEPHGRRFHAQPNACPVCGPRLEFWECGDMSPLSKRGHVRALQNNDALPAAAKAIRDGKIVAVKGLGGFHLMADARNEKAVQLLRERKHREEKPFALMFPSLASVKADWKSRRWKNDATFVRITHRIVRRLSILHSPSLGAAREKR